MNSETEAMTRSVICGQVEVFVAHGGRLFLGARFLVALKMAKTVASMARTIRLQAKLMPRRKIFAIRTRTLIFYLVLGLGHVYRSFVETYQIFSLLLLRICLPLLQHLLFPEGRAEDHSLSTRGPRWGSGRFEGALERGLWGWRWKVLPVMGFFLHLDGLVDVAEADVCDLGLRLVVGGDGRSVGKRRLLVDG